MVEIAVRNGFKEIGKTPIWDSVEFHAYPGSVHALVGSSGCGKTTLLNVLGLIDSLSRGELLFNGDDLSKASKKERRRRRRTQIGYLFQDYALVDYDTVQKNLLLANPGWKRNKKTSEAIDELLAQVGLEGRAKAKVFELSGGQKQRVALARVLMREPELILADEPTGALDRDNARLVLDHLRCAADSGACVIVATHDPWVVDQADTCLDLDQFACRH